MEIPIPDIKDAGLDKILVQPSWVSMCGSDIPFFTGSKRHRSYPLPIAAPIHECVGRVVDSTSDVFKPGDPVIAIPEGDRGLSEFFEAQASKAAKLPPHLKDDGTACLIQPLSTVINGVDRLRDVSGDFAAVVGLGSIWLFFCWLLKKRGAARIVGIDPLAQRCQAALKLGASQVIAKRSIEALHEARQDPDTWDLPDICIEAVGHQTETLNDCLKRSGSVVERAGSRGELLCFARARTRQTADDAQPDMPAIASSIEV